MEADRVLAHLMAFLTVVSSASIGGWIAWTLMQSFNAPVVVKMAVGTLGSLLGCVIALLLFSALGKLVNDESDRSASRRR